MRVIESVRERIASLGKLHHKGALTRGRLLKVALLIGLTVLVLGPIGLYLKGLTGASLVKLPSLGEQGQGMQVYDRHDKLICAVRESEAREPVPLELMSLPMRQAIVAAEDRSFFHHHGVDPLGILRALATNLKAGKIVQGGSTITQQLVRALYLEPHDRSLRRKLKEMAMSLDVDSTYSKNKILETYLNEVYFGQGAYGVERAARTYFNKSAARLDVAESAYLAGLVKAPSELGRPGARARAFKSQHHVLDSMVESRFIGAGEAEAAKSKRLVFASGPHPLKYPYYVSHVIDLVQRQMRDANIWRRQLKVYTNLDPEAQAVAEAALARGIKAAPAGVEQGALASISVPDGAVIALVGGVGNYESNQFNRAVNPHTAGSAFKPFVYLAALAADVIGPDTVLDDAPIIIPGSGGEPPYSPRNFDGEYHGLMTVRDALTYSRNVCAVWVGQRVGIDNVIATARAAGISSVMDPFPSLALGTCAVTPLEMASAYGTLVRSGILITPQFIRRIEGEDGKSLATFHSEPTPVLPAEPVNQVVDVLHDVVARGTGTKANLPGISVVGKTGTADRSRDIWFIGATPDVVTAVWGGNDENRPIAGQHVTGGTVMAGIWHDYMKAYYETHPLPVMAFAAPAVPLTHATPLLEPFRAFRAVVQEFRDAVQGGAQRHDHKPRGWLRRLVSGLKSWL